MTTQLTTTKRICEHLEKYVFDRVWNEPYTQYRTYIKPELLSKDAVRDQNGDIKVIGDKVVYRPFFAAGFFPGRYGSILLPPYECDEELLDWLPKSNLTLAVYSVPGSFFGETKLNIPKWTLFSTYCTKNHLDLQVFTTSGICLNRGYIYIKQSDQNDSMLIAIESSMYRKIVGDIGRCDDTGWYPHCDDLVFGKYFDSDSEADNVIGSGRLTAKQLPYIKSMKTIGEITLPVADGSKVKLADAKYVLRNGRLCVGDYSRLILANDYLEAIVDDDIRGCFDVTLDESLVYTDNETEDPSKEPTGDDRLLIHIPKSLNPDYFLITPNTCSVWVYPEGGDCTDGILLYSCGRASAFHQVTHNDFSISTSLLESIKEEKGWDGIVVRTYVRYHGTQSVFIRDGHYIDYLYNLDDDEIIQMLLGEHSWQTAQEPKLLFWKADRLEDSKYTDALLRRRSRELNVFAVDEDDIGYDRQYCKLDIYNKKQPSDPAQQWWDDPKSQCSVCGIKDLCPNKIIEPTRDSVCPYYTSRSIQDYIEILGYFHVLALIGKRVFHFKMVTSGTQYVIVPVPLALSYPELGTEDYLPIVYLNGTRVDPRDVSWSETCATNVAAVEMQHNDGSDLDVAPIIPSNYSTRLKVSINKVYRETRDISFTNKTRYYKKLDTDEYVRALVVEAQPVDMVIRGENGERVPQYFKDGVTYYGRYGGEYRKLVVGVDYEVGDAFEDYSNNHDGFLVFTGLDGLDPNELACIDGVVGDYVTTAAEPRAIYELCNDVKAGDTISVELLDRRQDGSFEVIDMAGRDPEVAVKHQFVTLDSWSIYSVTTVQDFDGTNKNAYAILDPDDIGRFDKNKKEFVFHPSTVEAGGKFLMVEGPNAIETTKEFEIERGGYHDASYYPGTTGIVGEDIFVDGSGKDILAMPLDSDLVFINNHRLIPDLDYIVYGYSHPSEGVTDTMAMYGQCVSYLEQNNTISVIRTNTTIIPESVQRGFVIGHHISWMGQTPIWFDELSTLTVDGKLIADYKQILGEMTLSPVKCRNGATYEVKTSVSTLVKDIMNYQEAMEEDLARISQIHEFFIEAFELPDMTAIIPHSHRLYSIFLEAIISKYLTDETFEITRLAGRTPEAIAAYKAQFLNDPYFHHLYDIDVVLNENKVSPYFLNFIDVYGMYHPLVAKYREDYDTLHELCDVFLPEDNIKHKEAKK